MREENFPVDFKWNKLNKVSLLITEKRDLLILLHGIEGRKKIDETNNAERKLFSIFLYFLLMEEAKTLNCWLNAIQRQAGRICEKQSFYHAN